MKPNTILIPSRLSNLRRYCGLTMLSRFLILTLVLTTVGCNRDNPSKKNLLSSDLLAKTPDTLLAFSIVDFKGKGSQQLNASPLSKYSRVPSWGEVTTLVGNLPEEASARMDYTALMTALRESTLYSKDGAARFEDLFSRGIVFFASNEKSSETPHIGFFAETPSKSSSYSLLDSLESSLKASGFSCSRSNSQNASHLTVRFPQMPTTLFLIATPTHFGISTKAADLSRLEDSGVTQEKHPITNMPTYQKATAGFQSIENPISITFVATKPLVTLLRTPPSPLSDTLSEYDEKNPIEGVLIQNGFTSGHILDARVVVTPKDSEQIRLFKELETVGTPRDPLSLPFDTAVAITLRTQALAQSFMQKDSSQIGTLEKDLRAISLGLRNNTNGSPVPDVFASLLVRQLESSQLQVKELARKLLSLAGQSVQWNSKKIEGMPIDFFTSLIGAGVYLGTDDASQSLLLASSETAMKDLLQSTHKKIDTIERSVPNFIREQLAGANVGSIVIDFVKTADVIDSVRGTLAMMTGGSSELNQMLDTADMRSYGVLTGSVSYAENIFSIRGTQYPSEH